MRWASSGVGTQMMTASASGRRAKSVVASSFFVRQVLLQLGRRDVLDVALAPVEHRHLAGVDVEAQDAEALVDEGLDQGQADVAQADDADDGAFGRGFCPRRLGLVGS